MQSVKIEPFSIIGISIRTINQDGRGSKEITELWQHFLAENILSKIPNKVDDIIYSLYTDYDGDHTQPYTAILGCPVSSLNEVPEGMVGKSFNGGTYLKIIAKGDLMKGLIVDQWSKIFDLNIERNYIADFEVFGEKAQNPNNAEVEFYIGLKTELHD